MDQPTPAHAFTIRPATVADIPILARHRCAMFSAMGDLAATDWDALAAASAAYFAAALAAGTYVAWLVTLQEQPDQVIAGGGLQIRPLLPRPATRGGLQRAGPQGLIVNVYTEPVWRRNGLAALVVETCIAWSRANGLAGLVLHAAPMGRALYERLGFVATNEMRYPLW
ncbi:MAG: GNAT family N-acetyltransferase [Chloroflexota bacterium]|nr:GNAT family N-acetyltransferase [Chloroflexota bacterium]